MIGKGKKRIGKKEKSSHIFTSVCPPPPIKGVENGKEHWMI